MACKDCGRPTDSGHDRCDRCSIGDDLLNADKGNSREKDLELFDKAIELAYALEDTLAEIGDNTDSSEIEELASPLYERAHKLALAIVKARPEEV